MSSIAAQVNIYNKAMKIAWDKISDEEKRLGKGKFKLSELLGNYIRLLIKLGRTDPATIASEAVTAVLGPIQTPSN